MVSKSVTERVLNRFRNSDAEDNLYVSKLILSYLVFSVIILAMNEIGVFYVPKNVMRITALVLILCSSAIVVLGRIPAIAKKSATKYVIMTLVFILTLVTMVALNFHAILALCIPFTVAINYRSKKVSIFSVVSSVLCVLMAAPLGLYLHTWDPSYFEMLVWMIDPTLPGANAYVDPSVMIMGAYGMSTLFVALPQMGYALFFGFVIFLSNRRKRDMFAQQIDELTASRDMILKGMADMVENRDLSTGDHIKRTSEVVRLLVETLKKQAGYSAIMNEEYCDCIIKTAPMHDLGKITIPDSILNKPGKLTEDEFDYIKIHPVKGYEIVRSVLAGLNDENLLTVAGNIALYHHERYDGTGYPKGLKGVEISLEARIMAIADVYDALVSARCYKNPIPHDEAYQVIRDSMGKQFDPMLWQCFNEAYPAIVEFYSA